ncbi:hypothetical protein ACTXT7_017323 [Hymenolepis weldensis]
MFACWHRIDKDIEAVVQRLQEIIATGNGTQFSSALFQDFWRNPGQSTVLYFQRIQNSLVIFMHHKDPYYRHSSLRAGSPGDRTWTKGINRARRGSVLYEMEVDSQCVIVTISVLCTRLIHRN